MKTTINLLLGILLFCGKVKSQTFQWKPTLGGNFSIQNVSNTSNNSNKCGFDMGLLIEVPLKQNISVEVGCLYTLNNASLQRGFIYPFNAPNLDAPQVVENYKLHLLKVPVSIVLKQNAPNPLFISLGCVVKYNINSHRNGQVVDKNEKYSSNFTIDTKAENKFGFGINTSIGKEFVIKNNTFSIRVNYDTDLSKWRYPTNFELEKNTYYSLRSHNFSLLLSYTL